MIEVLFINQQSSHCTMDETLTNCQDSQIEDHESSTVDTTVDTPCLTGDISEHTDASDPEDAENLDDTSVEKKANGEDSDHLGPLRAAIGHEVDLLNKKMIEKLGVPQNKDAVPTLKVLCDAFIFYNENRREVKDPKDILNFNIAMLIGDRMERILDSANVLFSLSERKFLEIVNHYSSTQQINEPPMNSQEIVAKRAKIIEGMKNAKDASMAKAREKMRDEANRAKQQALQDQSTTVSNDSSVPPAQSMTMKKQPTSVRGIPKKKHCNVCRVKDESVKLIKVVNSPNTTNKMICVDCLNNQKIDHQIRYTQIKNDKVYLKDLPKNNTH